MAKPRDTSEPHCPPRDALSDATLDEWRADADRWAREHSETPAPALTLVLACNRIAALLSALRALDAINRELSAELASSGAQFNDLTRRATELAQRGELISRELAALRAAIMGRRPFSATPVELEAMPVERIPLCDARSDAMGEPLPCLRDKGARCRYCGQG